MDGGGGGALVAAGKSMMIKHLASCNKSTRDKALKLIIKSWLPSQSEIDDEDMRKLWKGLFYCVWHSDKALVQSELINRLSSLLLALEIPLSAHYLSVFLLTMRREWSGIDALRLDKFYLLIRRFIHCFFLFLKKNAWDLELTSSLMTILEEKAFLADDRFPGNGVNYHIASVFLEELEPFLPVRSESLDAMFKTFLSVMSKSQDKLLVNKIKSNIFYVLLKKGRILLEKKKSGGEEKELLGTIALTMDFSAKFYELGSSPDCFQGNRKVLLSLNPEFLKLEKDLKSSGVIISVPNWIPIVDNDTEMVQSEVDSKVSKSTKKSKKLKKDLKSVLEANDNGENEVPNLIPIVNHDTEMVQIEVDSKVSKSTKKSKKLKKDLKSGPEVNENEENEVPNLIPIVNHDTEMVQIEVDNKVSSNRSKKSKKGSDGSKKKEKMDKSNGAGDYQLTFSEHVMSNLQKQFEKVAAEAGMDDDNTESLDSPTTVSKKKRKRAKNSNSNTKPSISSTKDDVDAATADAKSGDKSAKKVRFSMKSNLVWKPHSPLPPQSLRLPPSATPRGSALKKGLSPGPVREIPSAAAAAAKRGGKQKKRGGGLKGMQTMSPAIKGLWKLQTMSI